MTDCEMLPPQPCLCGHTSDAHYLSFGWCIGTDCGCSSFKPKPHAGYCLRCGRAHAEGECGRNTP